MLKKNHSNEVNGERTKVMATKKNFIFLQIVEWQLCKLERGNFSTEEMKRKTG